MSEGLWIGALVLVPFGICTGILLILNSEFK